MMEADFLRILKETVDSNRDAVLATVVDARGSVPREAGARMIIFRDGQTRGTVGGGAIENRIIEEARAMKADAKPRMVSLDLGKDLGMKCGGAVSVFLEALSAAKRLVVFGGGHIGLALYTLAPLLAMQPVIVDERPDFCNASRFPGAELHPVLPEEAVERLCPGTRDHAVIVTHRHERDLECLRLLIECPLAYIGMIGSRAKVETTLNALRSEGVGDEKLARVHAPIGLNLGGRTPGEIAVSIVSEIIAENHGSRPNGFAW
jgi:xanthine dehydrogenase accessory factor